MQAVRSIQSAASEHLLIPTIETIEQSTSIQYTIQGLTSVHDRLKTQQLSMTELYQLLHGISVQIAKSNLYLLSRNKLVLQSTSFIWINQQWDDFKLIYIPIHFVNKHQSLAEDLHLLMNELFASVTNKNVRAYEALVAILQSTTFTIEAYIDLLAVCIGNPNKFQQTSIVNQKASSNLDQGPHESKKEKFERSKEKDRLNMGKTKKNVNYGMLIVGLVVLIGSWAIHYLYNTEYTLYISIGGAFLTGILIIAAFRKDAQTIQSISMTNEFEVEPIAPNPVSYKREPQAPVIPQQNIEDATVILGGQFNMPPTKQFVLQFNDGMIASLTKEEHILGRSEEQADILLKTVGVSRAHCKIFRSDGAYYVMDLGAKNKTKLNGQVLESNFPQPLKVGDRVEVATNSFLFKVGE